MTLKIDLDESDFADVMTPAERIVIFGSERVLKENTGPPTPDQLLEEVGRLSLEGVVAKRKGSTYESGKCTGSWMRLPATSTVAARQSRAIASP